MERVAERVPVGLRELLWILGWPLAGLLITVGVFAWLPSRGASVLERVEVTVDGRLYVAEFDGARGQWAGEGISIEGSSGGWWIWTEAGDFGVTLAGRRLDERSNVVVIKGLGF